MKTLVFCILLLLAVTNSAYSMGWFFHTSNDHNSGVVTRGGDSKGGTAGSGNTGGNDGTNNNPGPNNNPDPGTVAVPEPSPIILLCTGFLLVCGIDAVWYARRKSTRNQRKGGNQCQPR